MKWVRTSERLPPLGVTVLGVYRGGYGYDPGNLGLTSYERFDGPRSTSFAWIGDEEHSADEPIYWLSIDPPPERE